MKRRGFELLFYVTVGSGLALGTSSFTMVGGLFAATSPALVLAAIGIAALLCISVASSVAEMSSMYPSAPGVRTYLKAGLGNRWSLLFLYFYLAFILLVAGVESSMLAAVIGVVVPGWPVAGTVVLLVATVVALNLAGVQSSRTTQMLSTVGLTLGVVALGVLGHVASAPEAGAAVATVGTAGPDASLASLGTAVGMAVFLFVGFEWVAPLGFRPDSYRRLIPISMPLAILVNAAAYAVLVTGLSSALPAASIAASPIPHVPYATSLLGTTGTYLAVAISLGATLSTFNAGVLGGARLITALAREQALPPWCGRVSAETGAPVGGVLTLGGAALIAGLVTVSIGIQLPAAIVGSALVCFVYAAMLLAAARLRTTAAARKRLFRSPLGPLAQRVLAVVVAGIGVMAVAADPAERGATLIGFPLAVAAAAGMALWSERRAARRARPHTPGALVAEEAR